MNHTHELLIGISICGLFYVVLIYIDMLIFNWVAKKLCEDDEDMKDDEDVKDDKEEGIDPKKFLFHIYFFCPHCNVRWVLGADDVGASRCPECGKLFNPFVYYKLR